MEQKIKVIQVLQTIQDLEKQQCNSPDCGYLFLLGIIVRNEFLVMFSI